MAWLPLSTTGDGAGHPDDGYPIMRNMLPSADLHHAVQDTSVPGDERSVMGDYLRPGRGVQALRPPGPRPRP